MYWRNKIWWRWWCVVTLSRYHCKQHSLESFIKTKPQLLAYILTLEYYTYHATTPTNSLYQSWYTSKPIARVKIIPELQQHALRKQVHDPHDKCWRQGKIPRVASFRHVLLAKRFVEGVKIASGAGETETSMHGQASARARSLVGARTGEVSGEREHSRVNLSRRAGRRVSDAHTHSIVALNLLPIHSHVSWGPTHVVIMHAMNAHPQPGATCVLDVVRERHALPKRAPRCGWSYAIDLLTRKRGLILRLECNGNTKILSFGRGDGEEWGGLTATLFWCPGQIGVMLKVH